eukprot:g308.t1
MPVLCAEAAVANGLFEEAGISIREFFLRNASNRNQFYCRALFVAASIEVDKSRNDKNLEKVNRLRGAFSFIQEALRISVLKENRPRYDFLAFNASVHFWNAAKDLLRNGARKYVADDLKQIVDTLDRIDHPRKIWRVQLLLTLAECYDDLGSDDKMAQCLSKAIDLVGDESTSFPNTIVRRFLQACVHAERKFGSSACKSVASKARALVISSETSDDASATVKAKMNEFDATLQSLRSEDRSAKMRNVASDEKAFVDALRTMLSEEEMQSVDEAIRWAKDDVTGKTTSRAKSSVPAHLSAQSAHCVLDVGLVALRRGLLHLAVACERVASRCTSKTPPMVVKSDVLSAYILGGTASQTHSDDAARGDDGVPKRRKTEKQLEREKIQRRIVALQMIERAIASAKRLGDPGLVQECAVGAWDCGVLLLTAQSRRHVHRVFAVCAQALESIESPMLVLRARLHFEVAKCELDADFLAKSINQIDKAARLDYGDLSECEIFSAERKKKMLANENEDSKNAGPSSMSPLDVLCAQKNELDRIRPLDKWLIPMKRKLDIRTSLYREPESAVERAVLLFAQIQAASDVHVKRSLLARVAKLMSGSDVGSARDAAQMMLNIEIWSSIADVAFRLRMLDLAVEATRTVLAIEWKHPERCPEMVTLQALACFISARVKLRRLRALRRACDKTVAVNDALATGLACDDSVALKLKQEAIANILLGMEKGKIIGATWIVENAAVYMWNYHIDIVKRSKYARMLPDLHEGFGRMMQALRTVGSKDARLFCDIARAVAESFEYRGDYARAVETCDVAVPLGPVHVTQTLVGIRARCKFLAGTKAETVVIEASKVQSNDGKMVEAWEASIVASLAILEFEESSEEEDSDGSESSSPRAARSPAGNKTSKPQQKKVKSASLDRGGVLKSAVAKMEHSFDAARASLRQRQKQMSLNDLRAENTLHAQLWSRLADRALSQGALRVSQKCATKATMILPDNENDRALVSRSTLKAISAAECTLGRAIFAKISPETQEPAAQDILREDACAHFILAAQWAARAGLTSLVKISVRQFWKSIKSTTSTPLARSKLYDSVRRMLTSLNECSASQSLSTKSEGSTADEGSSQNDENRLRSHLYHLLFEICRDRSDWKAGLAACTEACEHLPTSMQGSVWKNRVLFMSRLGMNVKAGVAKMKESNESARANIWTTLARTSKCQKDQLEAYVAALDALKDKPRMRVPYLVELGKWLFANHYYEDAVEHLLSAADVLLAIEASEAEELSAADANVLTCVFVALAKMSTSFEQRLEFCMLAQRYISDMWARAVRAACELDRPEEAVEAEEEATMDNAPAKKSEEIEEIRSNDVKMTINEDIAALPKNLGDWVEGYSPRDKLLDQMRRVGARVARIPESDDESRSSRRSDILNSISVPCVGETVDLLLSLSDMLRDQGYDAHVIAPLVIAESITTVCGKRNVSDDCMVPIDDNLRRLVRLKLCLAYDAVGSARLSAHIREKTGSLAPGLLLVEELKRAEQEKSAASVRVTKVKDTSETKQEQRRPSHERVALQSNGIVSASSIWIRQAEAALSLGEVDAARELTRCARGRTRRGTSDSAACCRLEARFAFLRGDESAALQFLERALGDLMTPHEINGISNANELSRIVEAACRVGVHSVDFLSTCSSILNRCVRMSSALVDDSGSSSASSEFPDVLRSIARCKVEEADLWAGRSVLLRETGTEDKWREAWKRASGLFTEAAAKIGGPVPRGHVDQVDILLRFCDALVRHSALDACGGATLTEDVQWSSDAQTQLLDAAEAIAKESFARAMPPNIHSLTSMRVSRQLTRVKRAKGTLSLIAAKANVKRLMKKSAIERWIGEDLDAASSTRDVSHGKRALLQFSSARVALSGASESKDMCGLIEKCGAAALSIAQELGALHRSWRNDMQASKNDGAKVTERASHDPDDNIDRALLETLLEDNGGKPRAHRHVSSATKDLTDALRISLEKRHLDVAADAALELVEMCGSRAPNFCAEFLCIYQSCVASCELEQLLRRASDVGSRQSTFRNMRAHMVSELVHPREFPSWKRTEAFLSKRSTAFRRLSVPLMTLKRVRELLTKDTRVLIMQHSEDGRTLYLASIPRDGRCTVLKHEWSALDHRQLKGLSGSRMSHFREDLSKTLSRSKEPDTATMETFRDILSRMNTLIDSLVSQATIASSASSSSRSQTNRRTILLCDKTLAALPLEALHALESTACTRDFSTALLYHRQQSTTAASADHQHPISYFADPLNEDPRISRSLRSVRKDSWRGVDGSDRVPSEGEWQQSLAHSDCVLFYGVGRLMSFFGPHLVSSLSLEGRCKTVLIVDRAHNEDSFRNQVTRDSKKTAVRIALEGERETAAILSLAGINTVLLNRWSRTIDGNAALLASIVKSLGHGKCAADAVRMASGAKLGSDDDPVVRQSSICGTVVYGVGSASIKA